MEYGGNLRNANGWPNDRPKVCRMKCHAVHALVAILSVAAFAIACAPERDAGRNELRRGNGSEPDSIDPQLARMEAAMNRSASRSSIS